MLGIGGNRTYPTVLLIDDDPISREVIATILTLDGCTLHTAASGEAAVDMLERQECAPEVVLVDVQLPGLKGVALVEQLRARSQAALLAISASEPSAELQAALDGFLLKPFSPGDLQRVLEERSGAPEERASAAEAPVISAKILNQFRELMPEASVREVYVSVVADLRRRVAALATAIAQHDAKEVRRIGHTIKGGCGMAGAQEAAYFGALLEQETDALCQSENLRLALVQAVENLERMLEVEFPA